MQQTFESIGFLSCKLGTAVLDPREKGVAEGSLADRSPFFFSPVGWFQVTAFLLALLC